MALSNGDGLNQKALYERAHAGPEVDPIRFTPPKRQATLEFFFRWEQVLDKPP
jgi:hypothetical protein